VKEAVIYARVSTKAQEEEGNSIPAQLDLMRAHAARHSLSVVQEFAEAETAGKSGRTKFNLIAKLLKEKNAPRIVLVEKTDRLTRNFYDLILVDELIFKHGVEFHLVKAGRILGPGMSTAEKTTWAMEVLIAKHFLDNLRDETKKGIAQKLKSGGWCWAAPYGYRMEKGELLIDLDRTPFVRKLFELRASGLYSLESVADALYDAGFIYQPSRPRVPKVQLHKMLSNRLYAGQVEYDGIVYPGRHQALVDMDVWMQAQGKAAGKTKVMSKREKFFIFRNALTCGACDSVLSGEEKKGGRYTYYRCWQSANRKCDEKYITEKELLETIGSYINRIQFDPEYKNRMLADLEKMDRLKKNTTCDEKAKLDGQLSRLQEAMKKAYWDKTQGIITADFFQEIQDDYQSQVDIINANRSKIDKAEATYYDLAWEYFELPETLAEVWSEGSVEAKGRLIQILTSKIIIKDKKAAVVLKAPFDHLFKDMNSLENEKNYPQGNSNPCLLRERELS
jgi:site-specific DNA recombinase